MLLSTERLTLREITEADGPFILELMNERGFIESIGDRGVRTLAQARDYIGEVVIGSYRMHGFGMWLAALQDTKEAVGIAGLVKRDGLDSPDIGYAFLERVWGRGYAQEAARAVLAHARKTLGLDRVAAITTPRNMASRRVLEKIGLKYVGLVWLPNMEGESSYFIA